jgi:ribonuclease R
MTLEAVVTGVEEFGLFVQGIELPAEGLVHVTSLADDYYRYERRSHTLSGYRSGNQYRLGDSVQVAVVRVDLDRRELDFRIVSRGHAARRPKRIGVKKERKAKKQRAKNKARAKQQRRRR